MEPVFSVSDFVAVLNQTLEYAYPSVVIQGELTNFRVSKNRWVYFDLKDDLSSVKFFGTVYGLPGPLEDGMMLQVRGAPRLHQLYGFSVNFQTIQPVGEGTLRRAAALLEAKLSAEGLFEPERKRQLPYPPQRVGLITSGESAAYHDFLKVLNARWHGIEILLADVQVQGEASPGQITEAIEYFNTHTSDVDVLIITRGGGSAEDLAAFSTEAVTRAVAGSRIPTLVAVGHEIDVSLAELAADRRASTPSNAAELLVPDKRSVMEQLERAHEQLGQILLNTTQSIKVELQQLQNSLTNRCEQLLLQKHRELELQQQVLAAYNPSQALSRGYAIVRLRGDIIKTSSALKPGNDLEIELSDSYLSTEVKKVKMKKREK